MMPPLTREELLWLPKAELHVHLRGAAPVELLQAQAELYGHRVLDDAPADMRAVILSSSGVACFMDHASRGDIDVQRLFAYHSFDDFLLTYLFTGYLFRCKEDLAALVDGVIGAMREQGIVYAEITVDAFGFERRGIPMREVWDCLATGASSAGVAIRWIVDLVRDFGPRECRRRLRELVAARPTGVVGITLGGSEHRFPPARFSAVYREARDVGLHLTVHAGEALGSESVREALDVLRVERVGHGVRAFEEPQLVERLAQEGVTLEVCPTSNVFTGVYARLADHPLPHLVASGVPVTLNSDDPTFFRTSLVDECLVAQELGLGREDVLNALAQAFSSAFDPVAAELARKVPAWRESAPYNGSSSALM